MLVRWLGRAILFAICLALATVLFALASVSMLAISAQKVFTAATYQDVLADQRVYERLPDLVGAQLSLQINYQGGSEAEGEGPGEGGPPSLLKDLSASQWSELASALLPPGWLPAQIDAVLEAVLADPPATEVRVEIGPLREHLRSGAALAAYRVVALSLPACDADAGEPFDLGRLGRCRPLIGAGGDLGKDEFDRALSAELGKMPEYTTIELPAQFGGGEPGAPTFTLTTLRSWLTALAFLPVIPAVLLVVLLRRRAALRWVGLPVLAAATVTFAAGLAAESTIPVLGAIGRGQVPPYWAPSVTAAIFDLGAGLLGRILDGLLLAAGAGALAGFVLTAVSVPRRSSGARVSSRQETMLSASR